MAEPTVGPSVTLAAVQTSLILRASTASSATRITNSKSLFMPPDASDTGPSPGCRLRSGCRGPVWLPSSTEVSERLVGSPAFKAGGTGDPRPAGSIPVHLRHLPIAAIPRFGAVPAANTYGVSNIGCRRALVASTPTVSKALVFAGYALSGGRWCEDILSGYADQMVTTSLPVAAPASM